MDDKIAETVEREASWLRGMDATRSADLLEALARDLAAARDRADHAWQRVAEADSAAIKAAAESLQHMLDKQAAEARVATLEASLSGGVLTKNDSLDLLQKLAAAEADRDRLATELAEARTVQAAAGVLWDRWLDENDDESLHPAFVAASDDYTGSMGVSVDQRIQMAFLAGIRALAKGATP